MQTKKDYSYGVVPIRYRADGTREYLLIYQYSPVKGDHYWTFPKGHAEVGETPTAAARRELAEETGLAADLHETQTFSLHYSFDVDQVRIEKEVIFYIGRVLAGPLRLQAGEVTDAMWGEYQAARERLTNENSKVLLDAVEAHLGSVPGD